MLVRRHFWRYATFGEVAELYASRVLRLSAIYIIGAFMSIYLFQIGYTVLQIGSFWAVFYFFKASIALPCAMVVGKIGPKHATMASNVLYIPAMVLFAVLPNYGPWLLLPILFFQALSATLYAIAYNVDFSKVKSLEHAGKEIAYMNIFERFATGLSPLVGGALAFLCGPQVTIVVSAILFALAAVPLLRTREPVKTGVRLSFKGFPWRLFLRQMVAQWSVGFDVFASGTVWALYTAVLVIGISDTNQVYLTSGILQSFIFIAALAASYTYGRIIDHRRGKELMWLGALANSATHVLRPFTTTTVGVAGLNVANEIATTGYTLPYTRAVFDNADVSGFRKEYLGLVEVVANIGAGTGAVLLIVLASMLSTSETLTNFFFFAAVSALLVITARFPLYKR